MKRKNRVKINNDSQSQHSDPYKVILAYKWMWGQAIISETKIIHWMTKGNTVNWLAYDPHPLGLIFIKEAETCQGDQIWNGMFTSFTFLLLLTTNPYPLNQSVINSILKADTGYDLYN